MNGYEYDALDFAESCEYEIHNRQTTPSPMPWKYLEQTGFVVDANGEYIAQTWNKQEEDFPNAIANGNAIENLTAENAKLREQLAEALDMLVNVHDLCNLDEEWAGKVAMVLAKNGIVSNDTP